MMTLKQEDRFAKKKALTKEKDRRKPTPVV